MQQRRQTDSDHQVHQQTRLYAIILWTSVLALSNLGRVSHGPPAPAIQVWTHSSASSVVACPSLHLLRSSIHPRPNDTGDVPLHPPWHTRQVSLTAQHEEGPVWHDDRVRLMPLLRELLPLVEVSSLSYLLSLSSPCHLLSLHLMQHPVRSIMPWLHRAVENCSLNNHRRHAHHSLPLPRRHKHNPLMHWRTTMDHESVVSVPPLECSVRTHLLAIPRVMIDQLNVSLVVLHHVDVKPQYHEGSQKQGRHRHLHQGQEAWRAW